MHHAQRDVHRASRTRARTRDLDQIQLQDFKRRQELESQPLDYEQTGLAQHYCVECARYFETESAIETHRKTKLHKRRCKRLEQPAYTIEEAERAGGVGKDTRTVADFRKAVTVMMDT